MKYEIKLTDGRWIEVSEWIFRSWTGERRIDGKEHSGDVFLLGTDKVSRKT